MRNIKELVYEYITETGWAELVNTPDGPAVCWTGPDGGGEVEPLADLGYNHEFGFYRLSRWPDVENEAEVYRA